jgi:hypothetical protein
MVAVNEESRSAARTPARLDAPSLTDTPMFRMDFPFYG